MYRRIGPLVLGVLCLALLSNASHAQGIATALSISVERSTVPLGVPFWVDLTVRWDATGKAEASSAAPVLGLPYDSPFEVVQRFNATVTARTHASPKPTQPGFTHEQTVRWLLRGAQVGRHALTVTVNGKPPVTATPVVTVVASTAARGPSPTP